MSEQAILLADKPIAKLPKEKTQHYKKIKNTTFYSTLPFVTLEPMSLHSCSYKYTEIKELGLAQLPKKSGNSFSAASNQG